MTIEELKGSLNDTAPPKSCHKLLEALWHDAKGDWSTAHRIAQSVYDEDAALVHAYLHRKQGDMTNAGYWYNRAGRPMPEATLEEEWEQIAGELI